MISSIYFGSAFGESANTTAKKDVKKPNNNANNTSIDVERKIAGRMNINTT